ncbi:hypothetical protein [Ammoniphilus sp. 3BR4]|uniref:hypothetical protein n=1 Tax=Ammoniphilus sp. 3BR4 TaxID=3158265 RepID=UPI003467CFFF
MAINRNDFRDQLTTEAAHLLYRIKGVSDLDAKYELCSMLMEIFEELDIEVESHSSLWGDMQINYQEYIQYIFERSPKTA